MSPLPTPAQTPPLKDPFNTVSISSTLTKPHLDQAQHQPLPTTPPEPTLEELTIRNIYRQLLPLTQDLSPCPEINRHLTALVGICVAPIDEYITTRILAGLGDVGVPHLRAICGEAEGCLERVEADRMFEMLQTDPSLSPHSILRTFPYHTNYISLASLEIAALTSFLPSGTHPRCVAFIGSGPLPLSSICMSAHWSGTTFLNIDYDLGAVSGSMRVVRALGLGSGCRAERMRFVHGGVGVDDVDETLFASRSEDILVVGMGNEGELGNGEGVETLGESHWREADVVILAALVGQDSSSKRQILSEIARHVSPGTLVCVRSAWGLRALLYPEIDISDPKRFIDIGLELLLEVKPHTDVVNSAIVFRKL